MFHIPISYGEHKYTNGEYIWKMLLLVKGHVSSNDLSIDRLNKNKWLEIYLTFK